MPLDEAALIAAHRRLERGLYNAAYRLLWDPQESQDMVQEACLKVWKQRERVDAGTVDALLWTTVLNLARNRLRWRSLWRWTGLDDDAFDATTPPERRAEEARLRRALQALPAAQRDVILLSEYGGFDTAEIARMLRIPAGTVASRKHQGVAKLRASMESDA